MATQYSVADMKEITTLYVERMKSSADAGLSNLEHEHLVIKLDKTTLLNMLNDTKCDGLYGILALNNVEASEPNQSLIVIPHDNEGKAIDIDGKMVGYERWDNFGKPPSLRDVVYADGTSNPPNIDKGISDVFKDMGID